MERISLLSPGLLLAILGLTPNLLVGQTAGDLAGRILTEPADRPELLEPTPTTPPREAGSPREDPGRQLLEIRRIYVDDLTGDNTADQIRDLIIASLHGSGLFVVTENEERADAFLRGAAEDLIYTDQFQAAEGADLRTAGSVSTPGERRGTNRSAFNVSLGDDESVNIRERRHEALATVRIVNLDGDVIWSTTQESKGAKFHGASADVAEKIAKQLTRDYERVAVGAGLIPSDSEER